MARRILPLKSPFVLVLSTFLVSFLIGIYIFVPLEPFSIRLQNLAIHQQVDLQITNPHLLPWPGIGADNFTVSSARFAHPPFEINTVKLYPLLTSLFGSNQGVRFEMEILDGKVSGKAYRDGNLQLQLTELKFNEAIPNLPLRIVGILDSGNFEGQLPLAGKNQSELKLTFRELNAHGLKILGGTLDALQLGTLNLVATTTGPRAKIASLLFEGPALSLKGKGTLRLGPNPASSSVDLNLVLRLKDGLDPALADMIQLLKPPQADGSIPISLTGSLANPRLN